ncbi:MAG: prepilin-type N-terminal cleavage/methylation domain-containing protein [Candidatus Gracilibacteria bacterium]|nr:prepilin-type N-terminal cleavage/methylation domain-containing protein [Candidatus Gracilibacteria bacterium]
MKLTKNTDIIFPKPKSLRSHGFTLVELIVVITILVILGTIAFMSLSGYSGNARDSSRVSDLTNLSKGLDIASIKTGSYPTPDNPFTITYSGGIIWTQGTIGDSVINILSSVGAKMNKKPTDPLIASKEYTYSKLAYGNAYQIKTDWEGDSIAYRNDIIDQANAASGNPILSYIKGNYNGVVAKTQTGTTTCILALPSIITNTGSANQTIALETNNLLSGSLLIHKGKLSGTPFKPSLTETNNPIVYCSGSLPSIATEQQVFATNIANAYSGTALATNPSIQPFISALSDVNSGTLLASLGGSVIVNGLRGSAGTSTPLITPTYSCTGTLVTANANISNTTGLSVNTAYQTTISGNSCYYACKPNYSGTNCEIYTPPNPFASCITANTTFTATTTYSGCTAPDIIVCSGAGIGQIWAMCNVGASIVFTGSKAGADDSPVAIESTAGKYFQWGENVAWDYNGGVASTDNCTWNRDTQSCGASALSAWPTTVTDTVSDGVARWYDWSATDTRGPCAVGYHVPTKTEWNTVYTTLGSNRYAFVNTLKIPMAGNRFYSNSALYNQGSYGQYWSSSPSVMNAFYVSFDYTSLYTTLDSNRTSGYSVRCLKN